MTKHLLTADEYADLPEDKHYRDELIRGVVCVREVPSDQHGLIMGKVCHLLYSYVAPRRLGWIAAESGYVVEKDPDTVVGPDVAFIANEPAPTEMKPPYRRGAPDLAVEIRSPSNTKREVAERVTLYLRTGSRLVWIIDPPSKTIAVHRPDHAPVVLVARDILTGEDVLPGFQCRVADVFDPYSVYQPSP